MTTRTTDRSHEKAKWVAISALITLLGTGTGLKLVQTFFPRTNARLDEVVALQLRLAETAEKTAGVLTLQERDLSALTRAMWRAGVRVPTNLTHRLEDQP